MHFRPFPVFLAYVFLSGKLADPDPLPPLSGKFHFFFLNLPLVEIVVYLMSLNLEIGYSTNSSWG